MQKRKKHSTETKQSTYTQNVVKLQEKTSPAHVPPSSGEATKKTNTQTTKNVSGRAPLEFMSSVTQVKFPNLTPTTMLQIKNDPLHMGLTEPYDPIHRNEKCMSTASVMEQYPKEQNADKQHNNAAHVSAGIEENTIVIQTKILPSVTSTTEITHTSNTSAEAESAVKSLQHVVVQQNVTVTSIQKETQKNLNSESTSKKALSSANVSPAEITETPGFLQSLYSTMHSHSAPSKETAMKIQNELCEKENLISGVQENPLALLVTKQPSTTNTQNLAKTTGPANELSNKQNITEKAKITEKLSGTKVPQLCATNNTTHLNTDNKQPIREVNKESNISKHITSISALPLQENESFAEITADDTSKSTDKEKDTNRAATVAPQLHAYKKIYPSSVTKKQSILQITGSEISAINQKSASSMLSTAKVQTKSDLFQNAGINFDLTASTKEAGVSTNIPQCSPASSGCPIQKSTSSLRQVAKGAKLGKEVPALSSRMKTVLGGLSTEDSDISTMSQTTQKSKSTPSHVNKTKEVGKEVPILPLTTKAVQGGTSTEGTSITCSTSQSTYACSSCPTQNSKSSLSLEVRVAKLSKEVPVHLSTVQGGASTKDDVRTTTTLQSTQKLGSTTSHGANVSELGEEVSILPPTTNVERQEVPFASNKAEKEALSVVRDNITTEKIQICVQAANTEMLTKTTKAKKAKQYTLLDTSVSKISLSPLSESPEPANQHITEESKGTNALMTQTEVQKEGTANTKPHGPTDNVDVAQEVTDIARRKSGDLTYKTQETKDTDNTSLKILEVIPTKISKQPTHNTGSSKEKRDDNNDRQNPDMKQNVKNDGAVRNSLTNITKKSRRKRKPMSCGEMLNSREKQQENKGRSTSHICVSNQLSKHKECKEIIHKNKTADTWKSHETSSSINNDTKDEKLKTIKADGKSNTTSLNSEEGCNKVCRRKRKPVTNKDTQIDMNTESREKSKKSCSAQSIIQDLTNGRTSRNNSSSCNKNVKYHKSEENTQKSFTDLLVSALNEGAINDYALQKMKKHKRNKEKEMAQEGNKTDIQRKEYVELKTCDHEEENIQSQMDPETVQGKEKQNEDSRSGDSSRTMLKKEGPNENKLSNSTQPNKEASSALSKGHLAHLTTTACLCPSPEDSERSETNFIPDTIHSQSAPKPVSTVDEAELEYQLVQRHIFLSYVCHVCKLLESSKCSLKKCSNCKMISYCSKEHQRQHWSAHKDLCKVISKICKHNRMTNLFEKAAGISPDQYRYYRNHYVNECTKELGRELYLWEKEMIYYPQVCHTCYESDRQKLTTCQKCHHVSYCQLSHLKPDHDIWCKEFQVYRDIILYQCYNGIIQPSIPDRVLQQYTPLTGEMKTFILNNNIVSGKLSSWNRLNFVALTDIATCPLTVLFSLQHCNFCLEEIRSLTIHLVGAEMQFEIDTLSKWELLLLHLVPSLKTLKVVFVGPQLETESAYIQTIAKKTCKECNAAGRKVIYEFWKTLYHDYLKCDEYHKPDLISAFNAGLYRLSDFEGKDTWSPSIEAMLKEPDIPVVVTEYTDKELPFDIQRIQNIVDSLEIIMPPARNPFASLKPSLNFLCDETIPVIFKNFHITILKRGKI